MGNPVLKSVIIGETGDLGTIIETCRRNVAVLAKINREMRCNSRRPTIADEDHLATCVFRPDPQVSHLPQLLEYRVIGAREGFQSAEIVVQELGICSHDSLTFNL